MIVSEKYVSLVVGSGLAVATHIVCRWQMSSGSKCLSNVVFCGADMQDINNKLSHLSYADIQLPLLPFVALGLIEWWLLYQFLIRWRKNRVIGAICLVAALSVPFFVTYLTIWGELARLLAR